MSNQRVDEVKKCLESDVYKKVDALERLNDDTLTSTAKLVDILDGYMTKLDDFEVNDDITTMEVISENEVDIEVDDRDMLREYNEKIHDFALDTLTELLSEADEKQMDNAQNVSFDNEEIDKIIDDIDKYKTDEIESIDTKAESHVVNAEFTQSLATPVTEQISDFEIEEDVLQKQEPIKPELTHKETTNPAQVKTRVTKPKVRKQPPKQKKKIFEQLKQKKKSRIDIMLMVILVGLLLFLLVNILSIL